jgi:hypothetical protein
MSTEPDTLTSPEPARARAVFSTEDFSLLRTAVQHYLRHIQDEPDSVKFSNLYHRLGRLG